MIERFTKQAKALSDPNRVRALLALRHGELCVCRLIELLQLAPSTVSKHLTILKQAGLVEGRKEGRWMHYRLPANENRAAWETLEWMFGSLENTPEAKEDQQRIHSIRSMDLADLTQIYRRSA